MPRLTSTGICALCGETFSKQAMTRHLKKCLANVVAPARANPQTTFYLVVEGAHQPMYWLHVEAPTSATLRTLDRFLRDTWVECCGHLSAFTIEGVSYELDTGGIDSMWVNMFGPPRRPRSMAATLKSILHPGLRFGYEYDFGTTTELTLKVVAQQERARQDKGIKILARNNPPLIPCAQCGEPAAQVCSVHVYEAAGWLCNRHAAKHRCGEDMFLPVVNSPRVGMCGYRG